MDLQEALLNENPYLSRKTQEWGAKVFQMEELPPFMLNDWTMPSQQIAAYLAQLLMEMHQTCLKESVLLPSIESLVQIFQTPAIEVQKALREMRTQGYDTFAAGLYGPVTVWGKKAH